MNYSAMIQNRRSVHAFREKEVPSAKIGELVLKELKKLDSVAYIRFASVYFNVDKPEGFRNLMRDLEATQHNK